MSAQETSSPDSRIARREQQGKTLQQKEAALRKLVDQQDQKEFFQHVVPLLGPLKDYIKRRLRIAYLELEIGVPVSTSSDILHEVVLKAYENYTQRPKDLTLEQWLYRIANERLDAYIRRRRRTDPRRRSLEALTQTELRTLEEQPITADAEGEVMLVEDLDDSEYHQGGEFTPPAKSDITPEDELEREEEVEQILQALAHVPEEERLVFQLFSLEGFPKEVVARITDVKPEEVPRIAEKVRKRILREIESARPEQAKSKAS
jgi:RNA polymerase sigma factor (sigma-70 family)